ncbi:four helix bundle protein [Mucilaginibacter sp. McL0603]|uniref:four helix bundle protein n=1 Tax=Mucilaginibacter sp. McL0603 TaxID=3415670 RepID=UPI003CF25D03
MNSFEDLETWQKCRLLRIDIALLLKQFPDEEKYRLIDQLKRASRSVTANIAEGHGRFHYQDNLKFCRNARGSLNEILDHLICAHDESLITSQQLQDMRTKYNECYRLLNGYIAFLSRKKE